MPNDFYNHGSFPTTGSTATSSSMRAELDLIAAGFNKLPGLTGNANKVVVVNSTGTALIVDDALPPSGGGTGITSYVVGDILYASSTTVLSSLADVATGNVLISGGVATAPAWGKVGLTTHVSGTLGVGNGGTGVTSLSGIVKGNGGSAFSAAVAGTDYLQPPSGTALLKANSGGALANATADVDYQSVIAASGILKGAGSGSISAAVANTDYLTPPSGTALLKANSGGALANAVSGTDYAPATSGTALLKANGSEIGRAHV